MEQGHGKRVWKDNMGQGHWTKAWGKGMGQGYEVSGHSNVLLHLVRGGGGGGKT